MKRKFKLLFVLVLALQGVVHAGEYDKKVHRDFPKAQITALNVINKFGSIEIHDSGGNLVTVDASVTVKDVSESKARQLLDLIIIDIETIGSVLKVETVIKDNFSTKGNFTINYKINIPKDRDLTVNNKYGNLVLTDLEGQGHFTIAYGNIAAGNINHKGSSPVWLDLSYGKADLGSVSDLKGLIKYSKAFIGTAGKMELETKYSGLDVKKMNDLHLESKYDGIRIGEISGISANSKYTNYIIEKLTRQFTLNTEYGSVRIDQVGPDFSSINITNSYGGVTIGLNGLDYRLDAECEYCDVKYPGERFKGNRIKENQNLRINGTVGSVASGKNIVIRSRYGGINLIK
jgi:hypothetical protein